MAFLTVGHSTRTAEELIEILQAHDVAAVADVRRYPASRRHPHFAGEALARTLEQVGIRYVWIPELGGRRSRRPGSPHTAWREAGFAGYADHLDSEEFAGGINRLMAIGMDVRIAILCAEAVPERCHRRLIADWLTVAGHSVDHLMDRRRSRPHELPDFARVEAGRLVYDGNQRSLLPHS